MEIQFSGPRYSAMTAIGFELDGIGELNGVDMPRRDGEDDHTYRERLIPKLDWLCGVGKGMEYLSMDDFSKWEMRLKNSQPVEVDGLRYFVQSISYECGRFEVWLTPCVPLELIAPYLDIKIATGEFLDQWTADHEWRGPTIGETTTPPDDSTPKPNHVRDAVRANMD